MSAGRSQARAVVILSKEAYESLLKQGPTEAEPTAIKDIPTGFRQAAQRTLSQLEALPDLGWSEDGGEVFFRERPLGLDLQQLLRALCVPFTPNRLPQDLLEFLGEKEIKCRNHLVGGQLPAWHVYFPF